MTCTTYGLNALPFGASGSVSGFLRVSTAVFHILTLGLHVWAGTFFDDFPIISRADIASTNGTACGHAFGFVGADGSLGRGH